MAENMFEKDTYGVYVTDEDGEILFGLKATEGQPAPYITVGALWKLIDSKGVSNETPVYLSFPPSPKQAKTGIKSNGSMLGEEPLQKIKLTKEPFIFASELVRVEPERSIMYVADKPVHLGGISLSIMMALGASLDEPVSTAALRTLFVGVSEGYRRTGIGAGVSHIRKHFLELGPPDLADIENGGIRTIKNAGYMAVSQM